MHSRFFDVVLMRLMPVKLLFRIKHAVLLSLIVSPLVAFNCMAADTILVFGDSLSAAYGLNQQQGWVTLLQQKLKQAHYPHRVINASISGETTAGGAQRIAQALKQHQPSVVILALGANDGLRGLPLADMQSNLETIIRQTQKTRAKVVLVGMKIPPNYGIKYTQAFAQTFKTLAHRYAVNYVPFLLEGVAGNPQLNQADGIHPLAQAQPALLNNVWPHLELLLSQ